ncbi:MAG: DUF1501 domain-containing protein [Pirellulales bacterium]|nr:DUF1501 domain-containing protein [Pirellulales bacterium]
MSKCTCTGNPLFKPTRREFLTVGALGALGFTLGDLLRLQSARAAEGGSPAKGKAKSVLHLFLPGGMAHQESFDPKPYAPLEYRGSFGVTPTKIAGEVFCETVPEIASIADKIAVIRSMTHGEAAHERGTHNMFTGYRPSPAVVYPSLGSVVSHELGSRESLPPYVCIPSQPDTFAATGYLSSSYGPFSLGADPASNGFQVRDLALPSGVDEARFTRRRSALDAVNEHFAKLEKSDSVAAMDSFYQSAYSLISSQKAREAFNIDAEPAAIRDEYGRNAAGQRLLMARRLVAAGVRVVSVTYGGWDMHTNIVGGMRGQMPALDKAFATLIRDLDRTGLLDETLVMISSEFGRTPKINGDAGRDHWPKVFSVVLAGGGIKRGVIIGSSNATASDPETDPVGPSDLFATIYHALGIDFEKRLIAPGDRPLAIVRDGTICQNLLA